MKKMLTPWFEKMGIKVGTHRGLSFVLLLCLSGGIGQSCSEEENLMYEKTKESSAKFYCTHDVRTVIGESRGSGEILYNKQSADFNVQIKTGDITENSGSRAGSDEFDWPTQIDGHEQIAIYIEKNPAVGKDVIFDKEYSNMAYNPFTRTIRPWKKWANLSDINNTYTDIDDYIQENLFVNKGIQSLSFYGYTIRPSDYHAGSGGLNYTPKSIVAKIDEMTLTETKLNYVFLQSGQNDTSIAYHDIMYCIGEEKENSQTGRFGNLYIKPKESVQMHFRHAFSLLDISINKGKYSGEGIISSITVKGSHVYDEGSVDLVTGVVTADTRSQETGGKSIVRKFGADGTDVIQMTTNRPAKTQIIINPVDLPENAPGNTFDIVCRIDGIDYTCSLSDVEFKSGYKYNLQLTLNPQGITVLDMWYGGQSITVNGNSTQNYSIYGPQRVVEGESFSVTPAEGFNLAKVVRNGIEIASDDGSYPLVFSEEGENVTYDIMFTPAESWYVDQAAMNVHFDALMNDKYNGLKGQVPTVKEWTQQLTTGWCDLSGKGNHGQLNGFDLTAFSENPVTDRTKHADDGSTAWQTPHAFYNSFSYSGWDGKGLKFDGLDDVVTFTSDYNGVFTAEFYICIENVQKGLCPRITAEPVSAQHDYPAFFLYGIGTSSNGALFAPNNNGINYRYCGLYGMGVDIRPWKIFPDGEEIVQMDFVFNGSMIYLYINGEQTYKGHTNPGTKPGRLNPQLKSYLSSLGSRIQDNSRGLNATYYSYILYDRVLTMEEIQQNYQTNVKRFGTSKRNVMEEGSE